MNKLQLAFLLNLFWLLSIAATGYFLVWIVWDNMAYPKPLMLHLMSNLTNYFLFFLSALSASLLGVLKSIPAYYPMSTAGPGSNPGKKRKTPEKRKREKGKEEKKEEKKEERKLPVW